jgi:uncharacterized protein
MPGKKTKKRKKASKRRKAKKKFPFTLVFIFLLVASAAGSFYFIFLRAPQQQKKPPKQVVKLKSIHKHQPEKQTGKKSENLAPPKKIIYEEPPSDKNPLPPPVLRPEKQKKKITTSKKPRLALLIDDMGYQKDTGEKLLELDLNLSFAFLPHAPFVKEQSEIARIKNRDILLHLPMEPLDSSIDPGPGSISQGMSKAKIRKIVEQDLKMIPLAIGINNHMGSKYTQNMIAMGIFLELVREKDIFFVDSFTTPKSIGFTLARKMGVKTAKRNVFLDNVQKKNLIIRQIKLLINLAREHDYAIGIGHPHPATLLAIAAVQEELRTEVRLVGIKNLVW